MRISTPRKPRRWAVLLLATVALGCGRSDAEAPAGAAPDTSTPVAGRAGEMPDACQAVPATALAAALGVSGSGRSVGSGSRRVCIYDGGTIVGVSEADQYEGSVGLARGMAACEEVAGVGDRAAFCVTGGVSGQLMWVDGDLMYDVAAPRTDREAFVGLAGNVG